MAGIIVAEALLISVIGGILGAALSWGLIFLFQDFLRVRLEIPYLEVLAEVCLPVGARCLLIALGTGLFTSAYSAFFISREEPYVLIRENES